MVYTQILADIFLLKLEPGELTTDSFQCGCNRVCLRLIVSFNLEDIVLQPFFHSTPDVIFHDFAFYHLAVTPTGLTAIPCDRAFFWMRKVSFHDGTALFAEEDSCKGVFQFPLCMNGGMQNDIKKSKKKAPIICAAVVIAFLGIFLATILFPLTGEVMDEALAVGFLLIYGGVIVAAIGGVVASLRQRLQEIEGGEEDEATQY